MLLGNDHVSPSKKDWEEMRFLKILFCSCLIVFPEHLHEMLSTILSNSLDIACVRVVLLFLIEQKVWCISDLLSDITWEQDLGRDF